MNFTYPLDAVVLAKVQQDIADLKEKKKRNRKLGLKDSDTLDELERALQCHHQHEAFLATQFTIGELSDMHALFLNAMIKEIDSLSTWQSISNETRALAIARIEVVQRLFEEFVTTYRKTASKGKTNFDSIHLKIRDARNALNKQPEGQSLWDIRRYY